MITSQFIGGPYDGQKIEYKGPGGLLPDEINGLDGHCYRRATVSLGTAKRSYWVYVDPSHPNTMLDYVRLTLADSVDGSMRD